MSAREGSLGNHFPRSQPWLMLFSPVNGISEKASVENALKKISKSQRGGESGGNALKRSAIVSIFALFLVLWTRFEREISVK